MTGSSHRVWFAIAFLLFILMAPPIEGATRSAADFETVLKHHPEDVDTRLQYAIFLSWEGDFNQAEHHARLVIRQAPEYWDAHLLLARISGWRHEFENALAHVNTVLNHEPNYPGAIQLKLDILKWMQDYAAAETLLKHLITTGTNTADIYFRLAEVERAKLRYLSAYRHALAALRLDSRHQGARTIRDNTHRVTVQMTQEIEYFGFKGEEARPDRLGTGLLVSGTAFQNARISATLIETVRYRFRTLNNQLGLKADFRPFRYVGFTLMGQLGKPAKVVPVGTFLMAVRGEMFKIMDASLSLVIDILSWPKTDKALSLRPSLNIGFFIRKQFRLGAAYSTGILNYCELAPVITHGGLATGSYLGDIITATISAGYFEERDPVSIGIIPPKNCEEIVALKKIATFGNERFKLVSIKSVYSGLNLSLKFNRTTSLLGSYRLELKKANTHNDTIPAHITNVGLLVWF